MSPREALPGSVDVVVVGGGQAGLGAAYHLTRGTGLGVLVLEAAETVGAAWRQRWDSLTLFTPRRFSSLPGLAFPRGRGCPSRLEMAAYLERYVAVHALPVRTGTRVERVTRSAEGFDVVTSAGTVRARQVVVATGPFHAPSVPAAASDLDPSVPQRHSHDYRRPADVPAGDVLVVGGGNSAAQLAVELAATHRVTVAAPQPLWYLPERILGVSMYWWTLLTGVLNARRDARVSRYVQQRGDAVVGTELRALERAGAVRVLPSRVVGARGRALLLADGTEVVTDSVLWCTGFRPAFDWLRVDGALDADGVPVQREGASPVPGLHWMGLPWQTRLNSSIIDGVDRDSRALAGRAAARAAAPVPA